MVRIIAGALRGRCIKAKKMPSVRPISGRIKQSLFDILAPVVAGSRWLDLFAGTGAVGIEALSRGADFVFFVDMDRFCVQALTANLQVAGLAARGKVFPGNALNDLSWIPFRSGVSSYDFIFLGPPYKDTEKKPLAFSSPVLQRVAESGLLAPQGIVILQHHDKEIVSVPEKLVLYRSVKYGDTLLDFLRWK
jgi:16S rRNA (guanine(966)-N(2))-methyltransferase RsmD